MKKLLLALALLLVPTAASAQCTGVFPPNTFCGNNTGSPKPPGPISASSTITGPATSVVGDLALWNNLTGSSLKDQAPGAFTSSNDTNVTITLGGAASTALVNAMSVTMGWTGTLAAARLNANVVQAITNDTNITGSITAQNLSLGWTGTLAAGRLNSNVVQSFVNDTNVTATIAAQVATLGWSGQLAISRGGTGASNQSAAATAILPTPSNVGDIIFWNGSIWTTLAGNTSGTQLLQENSSGLPSWVTVSGTGTVTSVVAQAGITGGTITTSGTVALDGNYSGFALQNCTLAASVGSNLLTIALKDNAGGDPSATSPCNLNFRSSTAATGSTSLVSVTGALSISTFATGATLGTVNATAFRFWVVAFNNSGTAVLGLINCSSKSATVLNIYPLIEDQVASSTPISGSATSAGIFYTPNGTTITSKAFRILGFVEYNSTGLVTAGTYASGPNFIQAFGPGIHKPGETIQKKQFFTTSNTTSNSTSVFLATVVQVAITPTSAANSIDLRANGSGVNSVGASGILTTSFLRTSTQIGPQLTQQNPSNTTGATSYPTNLTWTDFPNTISSTTYSVGIICNSAALCTFPGGSSIGGSIIAEEIMG